MKLLLTAITGSREGKTFTVEDNQCITFGRTSAATWSFEDDGHMSSIHFEVENLGHRAEIRDRGSTNGTWLNNEKIAKEPLREGDRIRAGKTILTVEFCKELVPAEIVSGSEELERTVEPTPVVEFIPPVEVKFSPIIAPISRPAFPLGSPIAEQAVKPDHPVRPRSSNPFDFDSVDFEKMNTPNSVLPPPTEEPISPFLDRNRRSHSPISDSSFSFPNQQHGAHHELLARRTTMEAADGLAIILDSLALKWSIQLIIHFQKIRIAPPRESNSEPLFKSAAAYAPVVPVRVTWNAANSDVVIPLMPRLCRADGCIAFLGQSATEVVSQLELMSSIGVEGFSEPNGFLPFFWPSSLMSLIDARGVKVCEDLFAERIAGVIMCSPWSRNKIVAIADDPLSEDLEAAEFQVTHRIIGD